AREGSTPPRPAGTRCPSPAVRDHAVRAWALRVLEARVTDQPRNRCRVRAKRVVGALRTALRSAPSRTTTWEEAAMTTTERPDLSWLDDVTMTDLERNPYATYERLRAEAPLAYVPVLGSYVASTVDVCREIATSPDFEA